METSSTVESDMPFHDLLSIAEKDNVEEDAGLWEDDILRYGLSLLREPGLALISTTHYMNFVAALG